MSLVLQYAVLLGVLLSIFSVARGDGSSTSVTWECALKEQALHKHAVARLQQLPGVKVMGQFSGLVSLHMSQHTVENSRSKLLSHCRGLFRSHAHLTSTAVNQDGKHHPADAVPLPKRVANGISLRHKHASSGSRLAQFKLAAHARNASVQFWPSASRAMLLDMVENYPAGFTGKGIKIGILSDSWNTRMSSPEYFPCESMKQVTVLSELNNTEFTMGTDEGRAVAELFCEIAPEAQFYFWSAFNGIGDYANGILELKNKGCTVIHDGVWYQEEARFSPDVLVHAIEAVKAEGVAYFTGVGVYAGSSWEGQFNPIESLTPEDAGLDVWHNWGTDADGDPVVWLQLGYRFPYLLTQWDEPWGAYTNYVANATSDLDVWACPSVPSTLSDFDACDRQTTDNLGEEGSGNPFEEFGRLSITNPFIGIRLKATSRDPSSIRFHMFCPGGTTPLDPPAGLVFDAGNILPHSNTEGAMAVGAASYLDTPGYGQTPAALAYYSSWGTQRVLYDAVGNRLDIPKELIKPDIVAPDGTATYSYVWGYFTSTTASAAHAAAIAVLMQQQDPSLTPDEIYNKMRFGAQDMFSPTQQRTALTGGKRESRVMEIPQGPDRYSGYGFLMANNVLEPGPSPPPLECPDATQPLEPGELVDILPGKTYVLQEGEYTITETVELSTNGSVTCFTGQGSGTRISIVTGTNRGFKVNDGAGLGLAELLLDGQDASPGVEAIGKDAKLDVRGVTFQRCKSDLFEAGAAVKINNAAANIFGSSFISNVAPFGYGGGVAVLVDVKGSYPVTISQVHMERNYAHTGGAIYIGDGLGGNFQVKLTGTNTFRNNTAIFEGGGVFVGAILEVNASICATGNAVEQLDFGGGFAFVKGQLRILRDADVNLAFNTPDAIKLNSGAAVTCDAVSGRSWTSPAAYQITGKACDSACGEIFTSVDPQPDRRVMPVVDKHSQVGGRSKPPATPATLVPGSPHRAPCLEEDPDWPDCPHCPLSDPNWPYCPDQPEPGPTPYTCDSCDGGGLKVDTCDCIPPPKGDCASNPVEELSPMDLLNIRRGTTYHLAEGEYNISQPITLTSRTTCLFGKGATRDSVRIRILTDPTARALSVLSSATLRLQDLVLDGLDRSPGIQAVGPEARVEAEGISIQHCRLFGQGLGGAAMGLDGATADLSNVEFLENTCDDCSGGALEVQSGHASLKQVTMLRNNAAYGGALDMSGTSPYVELTGRNTFTGNSASSGAIYATGRLVVKGSLCASNNTATQEDRGAGFLVAAGMVDFGGATVNLADNTPFAVTIPSTSPSVNTAAGSLSCNDDSEPWSGPGSYIINGSACGKTCNTQFVSPLPDGVDVNMCDDCSNGACTCEDGPLPPPPPPPLPPPPPAPGGDCWGKCCNPDTEAPFPDGTTCAFRSRRRHLDHETFRPFRPVKTMGHAHVTPIFRDGPDNGPYAGYDEDQPYYGTNPPVHPPYGKEVKEDSEDQDGEHHKGWGDYKHKSRRPMAPYGSPHRQWPACVGVCEAGRCVMYPKRTGCCYAEYVRHTHRSKGYTYGKHDHPAELICW